MKYFFVLFFAFLFVNSHYVMADKDELIPNVKKFVVDDIGQIYYVTSEGTVRKVQSQDDSVKLYNNLMMSTPSVVDAVNGMRLILYYRDYGKVIVLDNYVAPMATLNLYDLGYNTISNVAASADGGIWLFDEMNNDLIKLDSKYALKYETGDLRNVLGSAISPTKIQEIGGMVYLYDQQNLYVFDRFANYVSFVSEPQLTDWVVVKNGYIFLKNGKLEWYNPITFKNEKVQLNNFNTDEPILDIDFSLDELFVLTTDHLHTFYSNEILIPED